MSHTQARPPARPYVPHVPPPGSLQEWLIRALEVRAVQNESAKPEPPPAAVVEPEIPLAETVQASDEPAIPLATQAPAEPEEATAPRGAPPTPIAATARVDAIRARAKIFAIVAMMAAVLAVAVGWRVAEADTAPGGPHTIDATATGDEVTARVITTPVRPAAFGEVVTLNGWQVRIAVLRNTPQLRGVPALTTAAYPRTLRMTMTLVNVSDHALAADGWALSATANGKPVQMITYSPDGYVGVPNQMIQPGASIVVPVEVAMPASWADLAIEAVNAGDALAMSFTGKS